MPVILRRREGLEDSEPKREFLGAAYMHGIMEGEELIRRYRPGEELGSLAISVDDWQWLESLTNNVPFCTEKIIVY